MDGTSKNSQWTIKHSSNCTKAVDVVDVDVQCHGECTSHTLIDIPAPHKSPYLPERFLRSEQCRHGLIDSE